MGNSANLHVKPYKLQGKLFTTKNIDCNSKRRANSCATFIEPLNAIAVGLYEQPMKQARGATLRIVNLDLEQICKFSVGSVLDMCAVRNTIGSVQVSMPKRQIRS